MTGKISDVKSEITKLEQKAAKMRQTAARQEQLVAEPGFEEQVSEAVRVTEKKKLEDARAAVQNYERTLEQFRGMQI